MMSDEPCRPLIHRGCLSENQGAPARPAPHAGTWTCVSRTEDGEGWETKGIVVESLTVSAEDGTAEVTCGTYHLSPFALAERDVSSSEWCTAGHLIGADVLNQVRYMQSPSHRALIPAGTPSTLCRRNEALPSLLTLFVFVIALRKSFFLSTMPALLQYGAESWPAIMFLSMVAAVFLVPALFLHRQVCGHL